jgi:hypothetical protein
MSKDLSATIFHPDPGHLFVVVYIMHVVSPFGHWQSLLTFNGLLIPQNLSSELHSPSIALSGKLVPADVKF